MITEREAPMNQPTPDPTLLAIVNDIREYFFGGKGGTHAQANTLLARAAAALALVPVAPRGEPEDELAAEILAELRRARSKFPGDNVTMLALMEEVGELAKASFEESRERVRKEAVQVATMAMRVVLDGDQSLDRWRELKGLDPLLAAPIAPETRKYIGAEGCARCGQFVALCKCGEQKHAAPETREPEYESTCRCGAEIHNGRCQRNGCAEDDFGELIARADYDAMQEEFLTAPLDTEEPERGTWDESGEWWNCHGCGSACGRGVDLCCGNLLDEEDGGNSLHFPVLRPTVPPSPDRPTQAEQSAEPGYTVRSADLHGASPERLEEVAERLAPAEPAASLVERLRREARCAAVECNFDGDLTPERTFFWEAADEIERLSDALTRAAERERKLEDVLRGFLGYTVYPDDAEIIPAAMSHVRRSTFVGIVFDRASRALATPPTESEAG